MQDVNRARAAGSTGGALQDRAPLAKRAAASLTSAVQTLPTGYSFRPGRTSDAEALRTLVFGCLREYGLTPSPEGTDADLGEVERHYTEAGGWFEVLLNTEQSIVGSVGLLPVRPGTLELRKMYLAESHRGRGLGRALLERALTEARRRGAVRVTLETATVLQEALRLYERAGFRRQPFAPHVCRCDVVMELELPLERTHDGFTISTDLRRFNLAQVHALITATYWAAGIPEDTVARSLAGSLCFGLLHGPDQIGLARVVTDRATYAYLCDVIIAEPFRGRGLGRWLMETVMAHPDLAGVRRFQLVTGDLHPLYAQFGFKPSDNPAGHMELRRPDIYRKAGG